MHVLSRERGEARAQTCITKTLISLLSLSSMTLWAQQQALRLMGGVSGCVVTVRVIASDLRTTPFGCGVPTLII